MRKPRVIRKDVPYHVTARANRREYILASEEVKQMFLDVVRRARKRYRFSIANFCVMSNHFHFIITPAEGESLSRIMQWILSVFALRFNRRFGYEGHVWYDRFKSWVINGFRQFLITFRYIADNPVRTGLADSPRDFPWCGVRHIVDGDRRVVDMPETLLRLIMPDCCEPLLLT